MSLKNSFKKFIYYAMRLSQRKRTLKSNKKHIKQLKNEGIEIKKLSADQKAQIDSIYKKYGQKYSYDTHTIVYSVSGKFNPKVMPEDLFKSSIVFKLNKDLYKKVLTDKAYFELFMPEVKFPECIVKNISGILYDKNLNIITKDEAEKLVAPYDEVVIKPTVATGFGYGVTLVKTAEKNPIKVFRDNYIIQEVFKQHESYAELNKSSVNVVRVVTFFMEDKVYYVTGALRIGGVGAFTDNAVTSDGKGMIVIGIDENGKLREDGYFSCGQSVKETPGGIPFKGRDVYKFNEMVEIAKTQHARFPMIKFIGWDFAVSESGDVVAMEYNMRSPGVLYYQYANGPLFGDMTEKLIEYARKL